MNLTSLLTSASIDPAKTLVFRHRPRESGLRKVLPWLAAEKPDVFNAYQATQSEKLEKAMLAAKHVVSFIGHEPGKAIFIGLYAIGNTKPLTYEQFWKVPAYIEMKAFGMQGFIAGIRTSCLWFNLELQDFHAAWKGKLIVRWPPPERSWWRRANRNDFQVEAILEESVLDAVMPAWNEINLGWNELAALPNRWRAVLSQWRGIYYVYDQLSRRGYVGAAYGENNILGRWQNYAKSGHGGNRLLLKCDPKNFCFTILQLVSPTMDADDVIRLESTWKDRLHTRAPNGLNDN